MNHHSIDICSLVVNVVMKNFFNTDVITLVFKPFQLHYSCNTIIPC